MQLVDVAIISVVMGHARRDEDATEATHLSLFSAELHRRRAFEHGIDLIARMRVPGRSFDARRHLCGDHVAAFARVQELATVALDARVDARVHRSV